MGAVKQVLRYLAGTQNVGITYHRDSNDDEIRFCRWTDADFANDVHDRTSISGYVFKLGNGTIS